MVRRLRRAAASGPSAPSTGRFHHGWYPLLVVSGAGFTSFYLLVAVLPVAASALGGSLGAGSVTAVFMAVTVATQATVPRLSRLLSSEALLGTALILLGLPALLYPWLHNLSALLAVTAARGVGFGVLTVVGTRLVAALSTPERRGAAFGAYGLATSTAGILAPPLGLLLARRHLEAATYALDATCPLSALALVPLLSRARRRLTELRPLIGNDAREVPGYRQRDLIAFFPCAMAYGGTYTFLPLLAPGAASAGLLVFGAGFAVTRVLAGTLVDRRSPTVVLSLLFLVAAASGEAAIPFTEGLALCLSLAVAGAGIGGVATLTLVRVMAAAAADADATASAKWNVTFDVGIGAGGLGLGLVAQLFATTVAVFFGAACAIALLSLASLPAHPKQNTSA